MCLSPQNFGVKNVNENEHIIIRGANKIVVSEIRSLYRDENDLFRMLIKRIFED